MKKNFNFKECGKDVYITESDHTAILVAFTLAREMRKREVAEVEEFNGVDEHFGKYYLSKEYMKKKKEEWYNGLEHDMKDLEKKIGTNQLERFGYEKEKEENKQRNDRGFTAFT